VSGVGFARPIDLAGRSQVDFLAVARPGSVKIAGKGDKNAVIGTLQLDGSRLVGDAIVELKELKTGLGLRDSHMRDKYLEVQKSPQAKLSLVALDLGKLKPEEAVHIGELSLHGKSLPLMAKVVNKGSVDKVDLEFAFQVKLSDFAIEKPSFLGVSVDDAVEVQVRVQE